MIMFAIFLLSPDYALESKDCCCRKAMIVLKLGMVWWRAYVLCRAGRDTLCVFAEVRS